jgi:hypothetical protein
MSVISLLPMKKTNSAVFSIFNRHFSVLLFENFLFVWWGLVSGLNVLCINTTAVRSVLPPPEHTPHSQFKLTKNTGPFSMSAAVT